MSNRGKQSALGSWLSGLSGLVLLMCYSRFYRRSLSPSPCWELEHGRPGARVVATAIIAVAVAVTAAVAVAVAVAAVARAATRGSEEGRCQAGRQTHARVLVRVHVGIVGGTGLVLRVGSGLRDVVIGLAQRAACATASQPGIDADGMEGVAACQAADVVVVLEGVDTDGAGIAGCVEEFRWQGSCNVLIVFVVVFVVFLLARRSLQVVMRHHRSVLLGGFADGGSGVFLVLLILVVVVFLGSGFNNDWHGFGGRRCDG